MLRTFAKFLKILNSDAEPGQISLGFAFAMIAGFTPLMSLHNLLVLLLVLLLRVNLSAFLLGLAFFSALAFALDPLFHQIGLALLTLPALNGMWTALYNSTLWRLERFNNSIVMGSLAVSLALFVIFAALRIPLAESFTQDPEVIAVLEPFMLLLGIAQPFLGVHFTLAGALRGAGDTVTPLWSATLGNWIFRVPLALLVAKVLHMDVVWVWGTVVFDHVTRAIWLAWAFRRERWALNLGAGLRERR